MKYFFFFFAILFLHSLHAKNQESNTIDYNGIPGCRCFLHCGCYSDHASLCTPPKSELPQNFLWHSFMKKMGEARKAGPYFAGDLCRNIGYSFGCDCSMLSEYLDGIDKLQSRMEKESIRSIESYKKLYTLKKDAAKLGECIQRIQNQLASAKSIMKQAYTEIIPLYSNILTNCPHKGTDNLLTSALLLM